MGKTEQVLAFDTNRLFDTVESWATGYEGFAFDLDHHYKELVNHVNRRWFPRSWCEDKPSYRQVIPYCILHTKDLVYQYQRVGGDEKRLNEKWSLGIGGHINMLDACSMVEGEEMVAAAVQREVSEEVNIEGDWEPHYVGMLNLPKTDVGKVHFGLVFMVDVYDLNVTDATKEHAHGHFLSIDEIAFGARVYEDWSQACIPHLKNMIELTRVRT